MAGITGVRAPRQARSEQTFDRIVDATCQMIADRGTTTIPVREICDASGASKSSFYARFPSMRVLVRLAYDRFAARVLSIVDGVDEGWTESRPGGEDFERFVHYMISTYAAFFERERRGLQAFRVAEREDEELAARRIRLDREILERCIRTACVHYPELDRDELGRALDEGIGVIAAAARGTFDYSDELSIASDVSHDELVGQLVDLVVRFVPRKQV